MSPLRPAHPYITGMPHRVGMREEVLDGLIARKGLVFMHGRVIADWYLESGCDV